MDYVRKPIPWTSSTGVVTTLYAIGYLATALGRTSQTVRKWEISGVIPKTPFRDKNGGRLYAKEQIDALVKNAEDCNITSGSKIADSSFPSRNYNDFKKIERLLFGGEEPKGRGLKRHKGRLKNSEIAEQEQ